MLQASPIPCQDLQSLDKIKEIVSKTHLADNEDDVLKITEVPSQLPLQELSPVDRLVITKRLRVRNVLCVQGKKNRFLIRTPNEDLIYTVEEENSWWVGYLCDSLRPLQLRVLDIHGTEVMKIYRPYAFTTRMFPCQLQRMVVFSPPGLKIGTIEQQWSFVRPVYLVKNESGGTLFWIKGPLNTLSLFRDVRFEISRADGTVVGSTCKRWQGLTHALFFASLTDRFGVSFDQNLSLREKALLLAAALLIDYMYYDV